MDYTVLISSPQMLTRVPGIGARVPPIYNVIISNVPGPRGKLYFLGAEMEAYYPISALAHGQALNITVMSYAGGLYFGFTACHDRVPHMQRLAVYTGEALDELERVFVEAGAARHAKRRRRPRRRRPRRASGWPTKQPAQARPDDGRGMARRRADGAPRSASRWRSSARASAACASPSSCSRRAIRDFVILEKDARGRRHLARQHIPGRRVRRAVAPVLVLVRGQARLEPALRRLAGDPAVHPRHDREVRAAAATSASASRCTARTSTQATARWTVQLASGPRRSSARHFVLATGPLHVPQIPRSRASSASRARCSTRRAGTTATTWRASASPRSAPAAARSSTARRSRPQVRQLHVFQRTAAWVIPRDTRALQRGRQAAVRPLPVVAQAAPRAAVLDQRVARVADVPRRPVAAVRGLRARLHPPPGEGPGARAARSRPTTRSAASACWCRTSGTRCSTGRTSSWSPTASAR